MSTDEQAVSGDERRGGVRFVVKLGVFARWERPAAGGDLATAFGETENVGPVGALLRLDNLPEVGSLLTVGVNYGEATPLEVEAEVIRVLRHPGHPLAAISLTGDPAEWQSLVWEAARRAANEPPDTAGDY